MNRVAAGILALLVTPAIPAVFGALTTQITPQLEANTVLLGIPIFYAFAFLATVLLGGPFFLLWFYLRLIRWWSALISGIAVSVLVVILVNIQGTIAARDFLIFCPLGAASALVFWLIWRLGRDSPKSEG